MSLFIKNIFLVQLCLILAILYPTSLANLVVEVGTRHSHQTLLDFLTFWNCAFVGSRPLSWEHLEGISAIFVYWFLKTRKVKGVPHWSPSIISRWLIKNFPGICVKISLQWRHNEHDGVSNYQRLHCLLNGWSRRRSKKTSKLCVTGLLWWEFTGSRWIPTTKGQ